MEDRVDAAACRAEPARQVARAAVHPVLSGSTITGAGVADLVTAMAELLPATERTGDGPLSATVFKIDREQAAALFTALTRLSEEDPLIDVRCRGHDVSVRLCGEVQKEVLRSMLAEGAGIDVEFEPTRTLYVEKPVGRGEAVEEMDPEQRLYVFATVGLRVEPGSGVTFGLSVELGSRPLAFHKAIEETVHSPLDQGLYGWEVL
ncbi:MAG: ribosomal protection tetracycline resistance protein, partial [Actinomycetota bacterium]|nr:ribosomal protection tetracycline resistance protein [Actinomycetota bacterium]